jgi:hypothetical protein
MQWRPVAQSTSVVHQVGQVTAVPLHTYGVQLGAPAKPVEAGTHTPGDATELHTSHAWLHGESQQTPSTHRLDLQSAPFWHWAPSGFCEMHAPPVQKFPGEHWVLTVQPVGQLAPLLPHTYGAHGGDPAAPVLMRVHVPSWVGAPQVSQAPPQAVLQQ